MNVPGIAYAGARADLIVYPSRISERNGRSATLGTGSPRAALPDLKNPNPDVSVAAIRGPARGKPMMVGAASMGERAQVVFAEPGEIAEFIRTKCE